MKQTDKVLIVLVVVLGVLGAVWLSNRSGTKDYIGDPQQGDIYILTDQGYYFPLRVVSSDSGSIGFHQYLYSFQNAVPDRGQLEDNEWNEEVIATYTNTEIDRLYNEGHLAQIYRDE